MQNSDIKNPNNDAYWQAKGYAKRPKNWKDLLPKISKRRANREKFYPSWGPDGRGCVDAMFDPLCKEDY